LLAISSSDETAPAERLHRLRRYAIVGLDLTAARETPHVERVLKEEELPLLQALAAWSPPGTSPRTDIGPCLANVSHTMHLPLNTVIKRAAKLAPTGWVPPDEFPSDLGNMTVTDADARMLSGYCPQPENAAKPIVISPEKLIRIMASFGLSATKALQNLDKFSPFGYVVEARDSYPSDLTQIEVEALREKPCAGLMITAMELVALSGTCDISLREAHEGLTRIAGAGLVKILDEYPSFIDFPTPLEVQAARRAQSYIPSFFGKRWSHPSRAFTEVVARVADLNNEDFDEDVHQERRVLDTIAEGHRVTVAELTDVAFANSCSISEAADYLRKIFPNSEDLLANLSDDIQTSNIQCQRYADRSILLGDSFYTNPDTSTQWQVWPAKIAAAALDSDRPLVTVLDRLAKYRALGAPIPELSDEQRAAFTEPPVTQHDVEMLKSEDDLGFEVPVTEVDTLYLVQIAGRFGWTLREADFHLRRYVPFGLSIHYESSACPDRLVHWQDLLGLTAYLDGQAPILQGQVSTAHLVAASALFNESPEQVRDRLRPYAELIGFTLDEEPIVV
jgi:hypothetical protein